MLENITLSADNLEEVMKKLNALFEGKPVDLSGFKEIQDLSAIDYEKSIKYREYRILTITQRFSSCLSRFGAESSWEAPSDRGLLVQIGDEISILENMVVCIHQTPGFSPRKMTILEFEGGPPPPKAEAPIDVILPDGIGSSPPSEGPVGIVAH